MVDTLAAEGDDATEHQPTSRLCRTRERLVISSGLVLMLDQFMLANDQFLRLLPEGEFDLLSASEALNKAAKSYGGCVLQIGSDTYCVLRDPSEQVIALCPRGLCVEVDTVEQESSPEYSFDLETLVEQRGNLRALEQVYVDTRCLVLVDANILTDQPSLEEYRDLRKASKDKPARDLIRSYGGAVRYGFNRYGDELGVFRLSEPDILVLWPDVTD